MFFSKVDLEKTQLPDRDQLLLLNDSDLAGFCRIDVFAGTGPGGQHRNRNYTAVRTVLKAAPELVTEESTSRSQKQNLEKALQKMRIKIAQCCRKKPLDNYSYTHFNEENQLYALELARLLDAVAANEFDHKAAAEKCNLSNTALLRELARDYTVWNEFASARRFLNLSELKKPGS